MRHCIRCVMPSTRPGIQFDEHGVCYPCLAAEKARTTDWSARMRELEELCDTHRVRHRDQPYDCVVAVSGGKDSHFQVKTLVDLGMRPLLVSTGDWFRHTRTGEQNFRNLCEVFDCDSYLFRQSPATMREMIKMAFIELGSPTWPIDSAIYSIPLRMAAMHQVELVVYGENISYTYGGPGAVETPSARRQIDNRAVLPLDRGWWGIRGIDLPPMLEYPPQETLNALEPIYLSYFTPWSGYRNYLTMSMYGFHSLGAEWRRQGYIDEHDQIDSYGYLTHAWLKYPKYGHQRVTEMASYLIRDDRMTRDEAVDLVLRYDHLADPEMIDDFLAFTGISTVGFWTRVDDLYNREIFDRGDGEWKIKQPVRKLS